MKKRVLSSIMVMMLVLTSININATVANEVTEKIFFPNGDWRYEEVLVNVSSKDSFVNALNMLVSAENIPTNCYNEFPKGIKVLDVIIVEEQIAKVFLSRNTKKKVDGLNYSYDVMQEILSRSIYEKYPNVEEVSLIIGKKEFSINSKSNLIPENKAFPQEEELSKTIESVLSEMDNISMTEDEVKKNVEQNLDERIASDQQFSTSMASVSGMKICIDPGHGGSEPGAIATFSGVTYYEKDFNLSIANALKSYLEGKGMIVVMTRRNDSTTSLTGRIMTANFNDVDIFISTHCNSSNYTIKAGTTCIWPSNHDVNESIDLAYSVNDNVYARTPFGYYQPYEDTRGLAVLNGTHMPAIITETGYMSNGTDLSYLKDASNRIIIGKAIGIGVEYYVN